MTTLEQPAAFKISLSDLMQKFSIELDVCAIRHIANNFVLPERERVTMCFVNGGMIHGFSTVWGGNQTTAYLLQHPIKMQWAGHISESQPIQTPSLQRCQKTAYLTPEIAKQRLREIRVSRQRDKTPIRHYKCGKCGFYHLTSKPLMK